jgi:hypothetical protein
MPECDNAVPGGSRSKKLMSFAGVLADQARMFLTRQVVLFSMLFANRVGMGGDAF